jgi:Flp pilus assembly pilin Flp
VLAEFIYAVIVTILAIVVVQGLTRLAQREEQLTSKLPFGKKPSE